MSDFEREAFEATAQEKWPQYSLLTDKCGAYSEVFLQGAWEGWQSACSQGGEVEPVAWDDPAVDPIVSKLYKKFKDWSQRGFTADDVTWCEVRGYVAELLNTHPPAPTQGVPDWVRCDERLPHISDGDERCSLWVSGLYENTGNRFVMMAFVGEAIDLAQKGAIDHFMPTGLTRPQPPKDKQEDSGDE